MKRSQYKSYFLLLAVFCHQSLMAQYTGGTSDGFSSDQFNKQQITDANAFKGGADDGFSAAFFNRQVINDANAFRGGSDDGFSLASFSRILMNDSNAFRGGSEDGFSLASFSRLNPNDASAFKGGADDGFSVFLLNRKSFIDSNAFKGGGNDGFAFSVYLKNAALPVNLISFSGRWNDNTAVLNWQTAAGSSAAQFVVERSFTGNNDFIPVGTRQPASNSNNNTGYVFDDSSVAAVFATQKYFFYRLKMFDRAGGYTYSAYVLLVKERSLQFSVSLFPNPASNYVSVSVDGVSDHRPLNINVHDLNGRLVIRQSMSTSPGRVNTYQLPPGQYFLSVYDQDKLLKTIPVIIQH